MHGWAHRAAVTTTGAETGSVRTSSLSWVDRSHEPEVGPIPQG